MISRRGFLAGAAGLAVAAGWPPRPGRVAWAQGRPFVFVSWGGALSAMEKDAFMDPFAAKHGIPIVNTSPTNYAKLKAMVQAGAVEWDLVDVGGRFIYQGRDQGLLEEIDHAVVDASKLDRRWVTRHGVFTSVGATVIAYNTKAFSEGQGPDSWKAFWDVRRFPGPRGLYKPFYYNYEAAMLAAGVSRDEVYPVTDEKVKLALGKLTELKPHVKVWWSAGAQPAQLLASGELAVSSAWSGRILDIRKEKAPVAMTYKDGLAWGNAYVVPKGTPHRALAMRVIDYCLSEEAQTRLLAIGTYAPVHPGAVARATPEQKAQMPTHPENLKDMLILDEEQAALYSTRYEEAWNRFQLG